MRSENENIKLETGRHSECGQAAECLLSEVTECERTKNEAVRQFALELAVYGAP
jgi:hypothetical protein